MERFRLKKVELGIKGILCAIQLLEDAFLVPDFSVEITPKTAPLVSESLLKLYEYLTKKKDLPLDFDDSTTFLFKKKMHGQFKILREPNFFKVTGVLYKNVGRGKHYLYDMRISWERSSTGSVFVLQEKVSSKVYYPNNTYSTFPSRRNFEEELDILRKIASSDDVVPTYEFFYKNYWDLFESLFRFQPSLISTLYHIIDFILTPENYDILSSRNFEERKLESVRKKFVAGKDAFDILSKFSVLEKLI